MSASTSKKSQPPIKSDYYAWSAKMSESQRELERLGVDTTPQRLEPGAAAAAAAAAAPAAVASGSGAGAGVGGAPAPSAPAAAAVAAPVGASAWNAGGTWEERDRSKFGEAKLKELLLQFRAPVDLAGLPAQLEVTDVSLCSGTASVVYVRRKLRAGFEMEVKAAWHLKLRPEPAPTPAPTPAAAPAAAPDASNAFADVDSEPDSDDEGAAAAPPAAPAAAAPAAADDGGEPLATGSLHMPEVSDDAGGEYEVKYTVSQSGGMDVMPALRGLAPHINGLLAQWVEALKQP